MYISPKTAALFWINKKVAAWHALGHVTNISCGMTTAHEQITIKTIKLLMLYN